MTDDELRLAVAERLGWTNVRLVTHADFDSTFHDGTVYETLDGRKPGGVHDSDLVPNWPVSIADAWELVEKDDWFGKEGLGVVRYGDGWTVAGISYCLELNYPEAPTAPRAICLAYLNATALKPTPREREGER